MKEAYDHLADHFFSARIYKVFYTVSFSMALLFIFTDAIVSFELIELSDTDYTIVEYLKTGCAVLFWLCMIIFCIMYSNQHNRNKPGRMGSSSGRNAP